MQERENLEGRSSKDLRSFSPHEKVWDFSGYNKNPRLAEILEVLRDGDRTVLKLKDEKGETVTSSDNVLKMEEVTPDE